MQALKIIIQGNVQGVGYRRWFEQQAQELQLTGYVKNLDNGDVEAEIIGEEMQIQEILKRSLVGPLRTQVTKIERIPFDPAEREYTHFQMIR
ncbi:acylphosphatase [Acinetobacter indicus]|uniref:acylphosphatase n=1 Tax=Acinetobacter indicus TaxID=756892 RepID=UPI000CEC3067|nr:acylphosphatase [Acinetobacter indicus]